MNNTPTITQELLQTAMSYSDYRALINEMLTENRVTGDFMENNDWIVEYTKLNNQRMDRGETVFEATAALKNSISSITDPWIWLVITEGWCGDAAQIIPGIVEAAALNPNFSVKFILRDEHPEVIDAYLTNGGRSIPKLIVLNANTLKEIGNWGPRPAVAQKMTMDYKENKDMGFKAYVEKLHTWYENDLFEGIQSELVECLKEWAK